MSVARLDHAATLLKDGTVLITGGHNVYGLTLVTAELYDPKSRTFATVGRMVQARQGHTATLLKDGRVLIVGGVGQGGGSDLKEQAALKSAEHYDHATGTTKET